jgi:hypothetical protein
VSRCQFVCTSIIFIKQLLQEDCARCTADDKKKPVVGNSNSTSNHILALRMLRIMWEVVTMYLNLLCRHLPITQIISYNIFT